MLLDLKTTTMGSTSKDKVNPPANILDPNLKNLPKRAKPSNPKITEGTLAKLEILTLIKF